MAQDKGYLGSVATGANTIGELTSWDISTDGGIVDVTAFGDANPEKAYTISSVSGSFSGHGDKADTTGQNVLMDMFLSGGSLAAVWLYLYISGTTGYYGQAVVTPSKNAASGATVNQFSCSFESTGVWYQNIG